MTNMRYGSEGGLSKEHNFSVFFLRNPSLNQIQLTMTTHIWYHKALKCTALHRLYLKYLPTDLFSVYWWLRTMSSTDFWLAGQIENPNNDAGVLASPQASETSETLRQPLFIGSPRLILQTLLSSYRLTIIWQSGSQYHIWHISDFLGMCRKVWDLAYFGNDTTMCLTRVCWVQPLSIPNKTQCQIL